MQLKRTGHIRRVRTDRRYHNRRGEYVKPLVVLTMIVRNEAHVIERCLAKVRPFIDQYVIVDTGSTDDTKDRARAALDGIPGEIHDFVWIDDFAAARNRAFEIAEQLTAGRPAYAWVVDADDIWEGSLDVNKLTAPAHAAWFKRTGVTWATPRFFRLDVGWRYKGVLHEQITAPTDQEVELIESISVSSPDDGGSWRDPEKFQKHVQILTKALTEEPLNTRYAYYLAQSYRQAKNNQMAAASYIRRATMWPGGDPNEVYVSYLEAGRAFGRQGKVSEAEKAFQAAHAFDPKRREAVFELGRLYLMLAANMEPAGRFLIENLPVNAETIERILDVLFPEEIAA